MSCARESLLTNVTRPPWRTVTVDGLTTPAEVMVMVAVSDTVPPPLEPPPGSVGDVGEDDPPPPQATAAATVAAAAIPITHLIALGVITISPSVPRPAHDPA
jgi:hypothetical protein